MTTLRLLILLLIPCLTATSFGQDKKPMNFVLVLVDDLGWMDLGCQGSDFYETPHLDKLASAGMRFTNGYAACAVCSPTRAAVQTGRYPGRLFVTDWIRSRFQGGNVPASGVNPSLAPKTQWRGRKVLCPPNALWMESSEITVAEVLKKAGYKTCYIGKWHLGTDDWYPQEQGFDFNFGGCDYGQPPNYFDPFNQPKGRHESLRAGIPGLPGRKKGEYLSDREGDEAVQFIRNHKNKPFFLQLSNYAVHTPIQAKKDVTERYQEKLKTGGGKFLQRNAKYAAMVQSVDDAFGKIQKTLDELKLSDNTAIIFTSDNGGLQGPTNNRPLRSGKGYAYEGGIRVPWIIKWPGVTKAATTNDTPITSVDIFPTIVQGAGLDIPANVAIDGKNLKPLLAQSGKLDRSAIYWHFPHYRHAPGPYSIMRDGDWKLIKWYEGPIELFNLKDDLGEQNNLAKSQSRKVQQLDQKLIAHLASIGAKIPIPNPNFKPKK
jgi:arylsulfatase A